MTADPVLAAQELRVAIGRVARRMRQLYAEQGDGGGPGFTGVAILVHLARDGPSSPSTMAARDRVTTQAMTMAVRELEADGLVSRAGDPTDRRRSIVSITDEGRAVLRRREAHVMDGLVTALEQHLTAAERQQLQAVTPLLDRLADTI